MGAVSLMNDRTPLDRDARAVHSWLPPVFLRPWGRPVPTFLIALIAGMGLLVATQA